LAAPRLRYGRRPQEHRHRAAAADWRWRAVEPAGGLGARRRTADTNPGEQPGGAVRLL